MRYALIWPVLAALTGCAAPSKGTVPESLLMPCERPSMASGTNAGLADGLLKYDAALKSCNDDKAAIRSHLERK